MPGVNTVMASFEVATYALKDITGKVATTDYYVRINWPPDGGCAASWSVTSPNCSTPEEARAAGELFIEIENIGRAAKGLPGLEIVKENP